MYNESAPFPRYNINRVNPMQACRAAPPLSVDLVGLCQRQRLQLQGRADDLQQPSRTVNLQETE